MNVQKTATFNPFSAAFISDPYPAYAAIRGRSGFEKLFGSLVIARYADATAALRHPDLDVSAIPDAVARKSAEFHLADPDQAGRFMRGSIVFSQEPLHGRLRRLVGTAYKAPALQLVRPLIEAAVADQMAEVVPQGTCDIVAHFAAPLPVLVLCRWIGVAPTDADHIRQKIHLVRYMLDPGIVTPAKLSQSQAALRELVSYFVAHNATVDPAHPGNLVSLLQAARAGEDRLSAEECAFACIMSFVAGTETSQFLLANMLNVVGRDPALFQRLRDTPQIAAQIVEETLRYDAPLQFTKRQALADTDINGTVIPKGSAVLVCIGAANRDPDAFDDPDIFRLRGRDGAAGIGFGFGLHTCLGSKLARMQAEAVLQELARMCSDIACTAPQTVWQSASAILRGPQELPMRLTAAR